MHRIALVLPWLLLALVSSACSALQSGGANFNAPPVDEGPGCYDHKGRIERTILLKVECDRQGWVWKPAP